MYATIGESETIADACRVLSHPLRLHVIAELRERGQVDVETLATGIAAERGGMIKECQVELVHNHLPALADENAIVYREEQGIVEQGARFPSLARLQALLVAWSRGGDDE